MLTEDLEHVCPLKNRGRSKSIHHIYIGSFKSVAWAFFNKICIYFRLPYYKYHCQGVSHTVPNSSSISVLMLSFSCATVVGSST